MRTTLLVRMVGLSCVAAQPTSRYYSGTETGTMATTTVTTSTRTGGVLEGYAPLGWGLLGHACRPRLSIRIVIPLPPIATTTTTTTTTTTEHPNTHTTGCWGEGEAGAPG